jgi:hypothetical protein
MVRRRVLELSEEIRRTRALDSSKGAKGVNERVAKKWHLPKTGERKAISGLKTKFARRRNALVTNYLQFFDNLSWT